MADEVTQEEIAVDDAEAQEVEEGQEEVVEGEVEVDPESGEPVEGKDDALRQQWGEVVPELADSFGDLAPETRQRILLARLAEQRPAESPAGAESVTTDTPTEQGQQADQPPVGEVPSLDTSPIVAALKADGLDDSADAIVAGLQTWTENLAKVVLGHGRDLKADVEKSLAGFGGELTQYTRPQKLRAVMPGVTGATDADLKPAEKLLTDKVVNTEQAALQLAVAYRQQEVAKAKGPVSAEARRKGEAIAAARQSGGNRKGGAPVQHIPTTEAEYSSEYKAAAKRKKK